MAQTINKPAHTINNSDRRIIILAWEEVVVEGENDNYKKINRYNEIETDFISLVPFYIRIGICLYRVEMSVQGPQGMQTNSSTALSLSNLERSLLQTQI